MGNQCCPQCNHILQEEESQIQYYHDYLLAEWPSNDHYIQKWLKSSESVLIKTMKPLKHKNLDSYLLLTQPPEKEINKGVIYHPGTIMYEGEIKKGQPHNKGKLKLIDKNAKYKGQIKNGTAQGNGDYYDYQHQYCFQGKWQKGEPKTGKLIFKNDKVVEYIEIQDYRHDEKLSLGKIFYKDKKIYQGTFDPDTMIPQGKGKIMFPSNLNEQVFEGNLIDGNMQGEGKFLWQSGSYSGNFSNNKKHGFGKYIYQDGKFYEGFWGQGKQQGLGVLYTQVGIPILRGVWKSGECAERLQVEEWQQRLTSEMRKQFASRKIKKQKDEINELETSQQSYRLKGAIKLL